MSDRVKERSGIVVTNTSINPMHPENNEYHKKWKNGNGGHWHYTLLRWKRHRGHEFVVLAGEGPANARFSGVIDETFVAYREQTTEKLGTVEIVAKAPASNIKSFGIDQDLQLWMFDFEKREPKDHSS